MLVEGDKRTYHFKGANKHGWVAGSGKGDEGKRFCTLQLMVRFENGDPSKLYNGQPKPEVCFRGKGVRISARERAAWHPHVRVRFQSKAWYDDATCLQWAKERVKECTEEARSQGRESVIITDNLHGQTTQEFRETLWDLAKCKVHLLPGGVTDLLQLIDAGFGYIVKFYLGEFHSDWMCEGDNLVRWSTGMEMWERRAHITHMLHMAYAKACAEFNFEKVARKLGMCMTINGQDDDFICLQGLGHVSFCDAYGGSPGVSDNDEDSGSDNEDDEAGGGGGGGGGGGDASAEAEDEYVQESSDDDDDTEEVDAAP
jgi:hypothetical protein